MSQYQASSGGYRPKRLSQPSTEDYQYEYQEDYEDQYEPPHHKEHSTKNFKPNLKHLQESCVVVGDDEVMEVTSQEEAGAIVEALKVKGGGEPVYLVVTYDPKIKDNEPEDWQWVLDMTEGKKWYKDEVGQKWICVVFGKPKRSILCSAPNLEYCKNMQIKIQNQPPFTVNKKRETWLVLHAALESGEEVGLTMDYDTTAQIQQNKIQNWQWFVNEAEGRSWVNDVLHKRWTCLIKSDGWKANPSPAYRYVAPDVRTCVKSLIQVGNNIPVACGDYLDALPLIKEGKAAGERVALVLYGKSGPSAKDESASFQWVLETAEGRRWRKVAHDSVFICVIAHKGQRHRTVEVVPKKTKSQRQKAKKRIKKRENELDVKAIDEGAPDLSYFRHCFVKIGNKPSIHVKTQTEAELMIRAAKEEGLAVSLIMYLDSELLPKYPRDWNWVLDVTSGRPWKKNKDKYTCILNQQEEVMPVEATVYEKGTPDLQNCVNCVFLHVGTRRPYSIYNDIQVKKIVSEEEKSGEKITLVLTFRGNFQRKETTNQWDWITEVSTGLQWYKIVNENTGADQMYDDVVWICVLAEKKEKIEGADEANLEATVESPITSIESLSITKKSTKLDEEEMDGFCNLPSYPCNVCQEYFDDIPAFQTHLKSKEHQQLFTLYDIKLEYARKLLYKSTELKTLQFNVLRGLKLKPGTDIALGMKKLFEKVEKKAAAGGKLTAWDLDIHTNEKVKLLHNRICHNFLRCFLCNQFFTTTGKLIQHEHWLPHMERVHNAERYHEITCKALYPSLVPVDIGPGKEMEEELLNIDRLGVHHNQGIFERRGAYDPGKPDVADMSIIEMNARHSCSVCLVKFDTALDAVAHCRTEDHHTKYLKYLNASPEQRARWRQTRGGQKEEQQKRSSEVNNKDDQANSPKSQKRKAGSDDEDALSPSETVGGEGEGKRKITKVAEVDDSMEDLESVPVPADINDEGR